MGSDLLVEQTVDLWAHMHGGIAARQRGVEQPREQPHGPHVEHAEIEELWQQLAEACEALAIGHADDGAQDDLQRDRLHAWTDREGRSRRPPAQLGFGDPLDPLAVASDRLAVERWQHHLTLAQVPLTVER